MCQIGQGLAICNAGKALALYINPFPILVSASDRIISISPKELPLGTLAGYAAGAGVLTKGVDLVMQRVDSNLHIHIANIVDLGLRKLPASMIPIWISTSTALKAPIKMVRKITPSWVNGALLSATIVPVVEEIQFRIPQIIIEEALVHYGCDRKWAAAVSITIASVLFASTHNMDPNLPEFKSTLVYGIGFGLMMRYYGLAAAVGAHAATNISVDVMDFFGRK